MSYHPQPKGKTEAEVMETFMGGLHFLCKLLMWVGLLASVVSFGFLIFYVILFSTSSPHMDMNQVRDLIETFRKVLTAGLLAFFVGSAVLFWSEGWIEIIQLLVSAIFFLAPTIMPMILPQSGTQEAAILSLVGIQKAAMGAGIVAVGVVLVDIFLKVQARLRQGVKADQLKYGKGIKEETDRKNVFMGKCWQLPYCRKFVRERCPIYHARRSCWKEKVGCMCEEEVIKGAMENRAIPKDMVAAARYIPHNNKLTMLQKMERCRQCVIYNEHQKHKYRLFLPIVLVSLVGIFALLWVPMVGAMHGVVNDVQTLIDKASVGQAGKVAIPDVFQQIMLGCICMVIVAYALKLLEFFIFKLKL